MRKELDPGLRRDDEQRNSRNRMHSSLPSSLSMLTLATIAIDDACALLARHGLQLIRVADGAPIPGSYWGEPEAGVIGEKVYARADTPLHSLLHEACHLIVAPADKRIQIHTDASQSQAEEDAACYLQIVLGEALTGVGSARIMADMDAWGYTFRLGSARAWFERDAEDARAWLIERGLLSHSDGALRLEPVGKD
jgi:hypothetical protein